MVENISLATICVNAAPVWTKVIGKKINKTRSKPIEVVFKPGTEDFVGGFLRRTTFKAYIIKVCGRLINFRPKFGEKA